MRWLLIAGLLGVGCCDSESDDWTAWELEQIAEAEHDIATVYGVDSVPVDRLVRIAGRYDWVGGVGVYGMASEVSGTGGRR